MVETIVSHIMSEYSTQIWLNNDELNSIYSSSYWNNIESEKNNEWWQVVNDDFTYMENYLEKTCLRSDLSSTIQLANILNHPIKGIGADLASGVLWTIPYLLKIQDVQKIYCIEISQHRLFQLGPLVLRHYHVPADKVELCLGSFYDIKLPDSLLDFVVISTAFHHADDPVRLLKEVRRILKKDGVVLIIGEHKINQYRYLLKQFGKYLTAQTIPSFFQDILFGKRFPKNSFSTYWNERPLPDPELGDHYYLLCDYQKLFTENGFVLKTKSTRNPMQYFVAYLLN